MTRYIEIGLYVVAWLLAFILMSGPVEDASSYHVGMIGLILVVLGTAHRLKPQPQAPTVGTPAVPPPPAAPAPWPEHR